MRLFPEIKITRARDSLTLETGPALIESGPFIFGIATALPVWLFVMWMWITGAPFPDGPLVPVTFSTGFLLLAICGFLGAPVSARAAFYRSPDRVEVTTTSKLGVRTRLISPPPGKTGARD